MRIGIIITTGPEHGGTYFYSLSVLNALRDFGQEHECIVFYDSDKFPVEEYRRDNWRLHHYNKTDGFMTKIARLLSLTGQKLFYPASRGRHSAVMAYKLDLIICPSTTLAALWCGIPYIVAVHDIWHRVNLPGLKIFSEPGRDIQWRLASTNARIVLVESELGKSELMSAYRISESRIRILPTGPAPFIWIHNDSNSSTVKSKYNLPDNYVFYPGSFFPAKNQIRIIEALAVLRYEKDTDIHAILAGPINSYSSELLAIAKTIGVGDLIHTIGLVPDSDMYHLYKRALCLVMASYIGPTNMPIWEAFAAGCPVISSNAGEMSQQVEKAGLLFEPSDKYQLVNCIMKLYSDPNLRQSLIENGHSRIKHVNPENWAKTLLPVIKSALVQ